MTGTYKTYPTRFEVAYLLVGMTLVGLMAWPFGIFIIAFLWVAAAYLILTGHVAWRRRRPLREVLGLK